MKSRKTNKRNRLSAAVGFAFLILLAQPWTVVAQQWTTNGNNISNANSGNVGIGTTTPNRLLHLFDASNFPVLAGARISTVLDDSDPVLEFLHQTANKGFRWRLGNGSPSNLYLDYTSNGFGSFSPFLTVLNTGQVGIGTTSPVFSLEVEKNINGYTLIRTGNNNGGTVAAAGLIVDVGGTAASIFGAAGAGYSVIPLLQNRAFIDANSVLSGIVLNNEGARPIIFSVSNSEKMRVHSSGDVGIGTTSPGYRLDVQGGSINAAGGLCIAGDCKTAWSQVGGGPWSTSGSSVYYNSGNVGIGTTAPAAKLHLVSGTDSPNTFLSLDTGVHGGSQFQIGGTTNNESYFNLNVYRAGLYFNRLSVNNFGHLLLQPSGDSNVGIGTSTPTQKLDVQGGNVNASGGLCIAGDCKTAWSQVGGSQWTTSSTNIYYNTGNVGIGATSPAQLLHVQKDQNLDTNILVENDTAGTSAQADLRVKNNSGALGQLGIYSSAHSAYGALAAGDVHVYSTTNLDLMVDNGSGVIKFATGGNAEKVRIDASGNVGIGTATPSAKLHVVGDGRVTGNLTVDGNLAAKYQDVAEWVPAAAQLPAGTVVVLDPAVSNQVIASTLTYDTRVAGVISEQPGIALGESGSNKVLVATTGRVKVKVDATRGPIHIGDLLVTSDTIGMAMKSEPVNIGGVQIHRPGTLIGKALEPLAKGQSEILVLLSLQ